MLAKRTDAVKTRCATDTMLTRLYDHRVGDGWVLPWIVVSPANDEIQWDKIYTYPLDVVVDTPYKESSTVARRELKTSYKVASARSSLFGAGVGVIYEAGRIDVGRGGQRRGQESRGGDRQRHPIGAAGGVHRLAIRAAAVGRARAIGP